MTDPLDELLDKARLAPHAPYTSSDIDAAHQRLADRIATRTASAGRAPEAIRRCCTDQARQSEAATRQRTEQELQALCTAVVSEPRAIDDLVTFVDDALPEPVGGRVLGSILYLRARPEAARFWWHYAAGGGDRAALYCLYLHSAATGERGEAAWWRNQFDDAHAHTRPDTPRGPACKTVSLTRLDAPSRTLFDRMRSVDSQPPSTSQALRILRALRVKTRTAPTTGRLASVMDYVAVAVGWVDIDVELPMPDNDFVTRIRSLNYRPDLCTPSTASLDPLERRSRRTNTAPACCP